MLNIYFIYIIYFDAQSYSKQSLNAKVDETHFERDITKGIISYDDPRLIALLKDKYLIPPSGNRRKYIKTNKIYFSQVGQDQLVDYMLKNKTNGFFVEAGAYDGEEISNTVFFERERDWTGLLIEPNPILFRKLQSRNRNAYLSRSCITFDKYAVAANFTFADYLTGQDTPGDKSLITGYGNVQCFPFMTFMLALGISHINYFSLDIEGGELSILKQIDFQKVKVDIFTIEYAIKYHNSPESLEYLNRTTEFLTGTNLYRFNTTLGSLDAVFVRNSL